MNIMEMKRSDFENVPRRASWNSNEGKFDCFVIIPTARKHDSGWMCMKIIGCKNDHPIVNLTECSDVIHIDGIGGYNLWPRIDNLTVAQGWCIDCLPCGYFRLFCNNGATVGDSLRDFELFGCKRTV